MNMNTIQAISRDLILSDKLFFGPQIRTNYVWKNLILEKRTSMNWLNKLYKHSFMYDFWVLLSSSVS